VSVGERRRAHLRVQGLEHDASDRAKEEAKTAADSAKDFPVDALGSGSDYSAFLQHLGIPSMSLGYGDEGDSGGVYHSRYDTFEHHSRFVDPGFVYDALLARTAGRLALRVAQADLPLQRAADFASTVAGYLEEVKKLADTKRKDAETQAGLLRDKAFTLAADPTKPSGLPTPLAAVPHLELAPLENAVDRLTKSAKAYDDAFGKRAASLTPEQQAKLRALMRDIDQTLAEGEGLPGRPWYKNLVYAPGRYTGYGAKTLPGVREAIEEERFRDADRYARLTANALDAYCDRLDQATALLGGS
jgi:N-acetylated-alpha-linked acidic dipeptidase